MIFSSYYIRYVSEGLGIINIITMNRLIVCLLQRHLTFSFMIFSSYLETLGAIQEEELPIICPYINSPRFACVEEGSISHTKGITDVMIQG